MCWVKGCQRASRTDRSLCHKHEMRRWRAKNKKIADYCTLRDHASARGIEFKIGLDYWRGLVDAFCYYEPRADETLSIDRVNPVRGYVEGNLRIVTVSLNSLKSNRERFLPEHIQHMMDRTRLKTRAGKQKYLDLVRGVDEDPEVWDESKLKYDGGDGDDDLPF